MFVKTPVLLAAVAALASAAPAVAQTPPNPSPAPVAAPAPAAGQAFQPGAEVLSVEGEPLGVLAGVETLSGGERILHIRRADGSMTTAPAIVASRGERAVVLEWTRTEFDSAALTAAAPASAAASPTPPAL